MTPQFFIVDVFAERPYAGNPLAVVLSERALPEERMQLLAAETNFSETTFVAPLVAERGRYRVRIFTPAREIAFAGHPILGTAWVIRQFVAGRSPESLVLDLPVGPVRVSFELGQDDRDVAWFTAPEPTLGGSHRPETLASALGISTSDIDSTKPIQEVSAGVTAVIVPLRDLDALRRCRVTTEAFAELAALGLPSLIYFFCFKTHYAENDLCARFFFEANGAREDPATGNGAAFLGAYLLEHRLFPASGFTLRIEQGYQVGRPSLVLLRAREADGHREVGVGGSVVLTVRGELAECGAP